MDKRIRDEQERFIDLIVGVVEIAQRDARRGDEEAKDFLRELRNNFTPTSIPLRREQRMRQRRMTV